MSGAMAARASSESDSAGNGAAPYRTPHGIASPFLKGRAASVARSSAAAMLSWSSSPPMGPAASIMASYMGPCPPRNPNGRDCRIARRNGGA